MKILIEEKGTGRSSWFELPLKSIKQIEGRFVGYHPFFSELEIISIDLDLNMTIHVPKFVSLKAVNHIASQLASMTKKEKKTIIAYLTAYNSKDINKLRKAIRTIKNKHYKIYPMCHTLEDLGKSIAFDLGMFDDRENDIGNFDFEEFGKQRFRKSKMVQIDDMFVSFY